ncbi:MAG: hypothetical protein BWZ10_02260 [candidate division BRC1 bacterium ADurb.BinA364]|nr:MAG: hypothetical protein BWZ10_02260 [candidate division BRC1 bacterium ADurb.BinA364]
MRNGIGVSALALALALAANGCLYMGSSTNLREVAKRSGLRSITTGDGTFENYVATGHHSGLEWGLAIGIPFILKAAEIVPINSNEDLLTDVASEARSGGATSMIQVQPHSSFFTGIPFGFVGVYIDRASGTGIAEQAAPRP